jgi:hypothetical protein
VDAGRLIERAAALGEGTAGLVISVALVSASGEEHSATIGAPDGERLPSCSSFKPIVAAAVRSAAREGVVALEAPAEGGSTLELLLSHLSGLAGDLYEVPVPRASDEEAAAALLDRFLPRVPRVAPGRFWYSNLGYVQAGLILARAEREPLLDVVRRRVLGPAGAEMEALSPSVSLRAAGSGIRLRALDLARAGVALARGPLAGLGTARQIPTARLAAGAGQHPGGGFFVDDRYGRRLLAHGGGGDGAHGSAWVVDPEEGWSAAALFNHPAGYALDVPAAVTGQDRDRDPLRPPRAPAAPGWYLNAYAGVAEVHAGEVRLNGRAVPARCAADGRGIVVNATRIVIGSLPYDRVPPPGDVAVDPGLAGTFTAPWDDLTLEVGATPTVRSARRGESPAVALTPTTLATDLGVLELRGDDLVAGGAYPFTRT